MDKQKIKEIILKTAGNPDSGVIFNIADALADAIVNADKPEVKKYEPAKETRIIDTKETR